MMGPLGDVLRAFEQRLRCRQRVGGDRLPSDLVERLSGLIDILETRTSDRSGESDLNRVEQELQGCTRCSLHQYRRTIVVGEGDPGAKLVFVGEGPGEEEDLQGRPFVGPAGQLLSRIIGAMDLQRPEVYIANVVKCRPPGNRIPSSEEIACCSPFLFRQLKAISPQVICTLGSVAVQNILRTGERISRVRGRFHQWEGIPVMPTYHPSYLLRNPERKREVWEDVQKIMTLLQ
jgi:DNA polymerase